jgi:EAL domain-containing protein (putative c-di-GMP-specific phosphodiesterase class I)
VARPITAADLAEALHTRQFSLVYQPKLMIADNSLASVEALARWTHPEMGAVSPAHFAPLIEAGTLIHDFTEWVVETACADWVNWQQQGLITTIAVNVSARNLARIDLPDIVQAACDRQAMPCSHLMIELTESEAGEIVSLLDTLSRFRLKNIGVSLDDYGTGHANAARFDRLPFSELKIDQSYIANCDRSLEKQQAIRDIVEMAGAANIRVVAEGVETHAILETVAKLGCDIAQGYHLARPMPATEMPAWLLAHRGQN